MAHNYLRHRRGGAGFYKELSSDIVPDIYQKHISSLIKNLVVTSMLREFVKNAGKSRKNWNNQEYPLMKVPQMQVSQMKALLI